MGLFLLKTALIIMVSRTTPTDDSYVANQVISLPKGQQSLCGMVHRYFDCGRNPAIDLRNMVAIGAAHATSNSEIINFDL